MPKSISSRPSDINQAAHLMVERSTAEPKAQPAPKKSAKATRAEISCVMSAMGKRGGKIGGRRRLETMGFSRKLRNHAAAVTLNYFAYNFIKIHRTLRMSPAMAAGVTDRLWDVNDLVALWESYEQRRAKRAVA